MKTAYLLAVLVPHRAHHPVLVLREVLLDAVSDALYRQQLRVNFPELRAEALQPGMGVRAGLGARSRGALQQLLQQVIPQPAPFCSTQLRALFFELESWL